MSIELEMVDVICRCGLSFRVNKGNPQIWHAISCRDFYEDKERTDAGKAWRRANSLQYRANKVLKKKRGEKCLEDK